ncbi:hypothetical protein ACDX78_13440 [Virgibacillus oceani]
MLQLFSLAAKIDLKGGKEAEKSLDNVDSKAQGLGSRIGGAAKKVGKAGLIIGGAMSAAGTAAFAMVNKVTSSFDDIAKGSARLGVSTDAYQEMDYWASQNGMSHENMEKIVGRFNQRLGQAVNGNEKYNDALKELGVNMDDVRDGTMNTEEAFADTIKRLSELESEQDQVNMATEIFGQRTARDLLPALQDGALSMEDAQKKAEELGIVIGEDTLRQSEKFQDTWDDLKRSFTTFSQQILSQLMPAFQTMMDWIIDNMPMIQGVFSTVFDVVSSVFSTLTGWIQTAIGWLSTFFESNQQTFTGIWQKIQEVFTNVVEFLQETWQFLLELWQERGQALVENFMTVFMSIWETVQTIFTAVREIIEQVIANVVPFVQEKLTQLQEFWQENGAQIMEAVQNAFSFIQSIIETVMPAIQFIVEMVWGVIQGIFNGALNVIMGLIKTFSSLFTGDWEGLWEGIKQLLSGALEFVWNLINLTLIGRGLALIKNFASAGMNLFRSLGGNIRSIFSNIMSTITNIVSNIVSSVLGFFRNMVSGIRSNVSNIFSNIRSTFNNMVSFVMGLGSRFLQAGKNIVTSIADGIKGAVSKVTDAISGVVDKVRDFLPFSPAKEGPLKDIDKLNFDGPISHSIEASEGEVQKKMSHLLALPNGNARAGAGNTPQAQASTSDRLESLMSELIEAVKDGQVMQVDGKTFASVTGDYTDEEGGIRVRRLERGLAT